MKPPWVLSFCLGMDLRRIFNHPMEHVQVVGRKWKILPEVAHEEITAFVLELREKKPLPWRHGFGG